jgi:hypothetical protein
MSHDGMNDTVRQPGLGPFVFQTLRKAPAGEQ